MSQALVFWNDFESKEDVIKQFDIEESDLDGYEIVFASYAYKDYEGDAFVLLRSSADNKLFEVNGSHCSCYGLEGQWNPEETSTEALLMRFQEGSGALSTYYHGEDASAALRAMLEEA